jgi:hypothetical protein
VITKKPASLFHRGIAVTVFFVILGALAACHKHPSAPQQFTPFDQQALMDQMAQGTNPGTDWKIRILCILGGAVFGGLCGAFFSDRARAFRKWLLLGVAALAVVFGIFVSNTFAFLASALAAGVATYIALRILEGTDSSGGGFEPIFGNARPATRAELVAAGHMAAFDSRPSEPGAIPLGYLVETSQPGGSS